MKMMIISSGHGNVSKKLGIFGMPANQILEEMNKTNNYYFTSFPDTSSICIMKTYKIAKWGFRCAGDIHFFHDNLVNGYNVVYNDVPVISANYAKAGNGDRRDMDTSTNENLVNHV
jgi:hypothetical protein